MDTTPESPESAAPASPDQPVKKSGRKWWVLGIAIVLFLCLAVGAVAALIGFGAVSLYSNITEPVGPIKQQLEATNGDDLKLAYTYCSNGFKAETSYDEFVSIVENNPQVFKSETSSFNEVNIKNGVATVQGKVTGKDGTVTPMTFQLVKENGKWKILNFKEGTSEE